MIYLAYIANRCLLVLALLVQAVRPSKMVCICRVNLVVVPRRSSVWNKITTAAIIFLVTCRVSLAQGIHLEVDDTYEPSIPVDYPFVFPLTGLTVRELWVMSC